MAHLQQGRLLVVLVLFLVNHVFASHGSPLSLTHYTACAPRPANQPTKVPQSFCSVRSSPRQLNMAALAQTIRVPGSEQDSSSSSRHMAHQPRSVVVLVVLFLAIHVSSASPLSLTHYNESMCSASFECGGVSITYPFVLSSAIEAASDYMSYSCGYTDLKIFCNGEGETKAPILQLGRYKKYSYTILDIFYDNRTILLADTELLAGGKCPPVLHNVTFGDEWLSYAGDSFVHNLTFFSDCDPAPPETEKYQINCTESSDPPGPLGSRGRVSFVFSPEEHVLPREYRLAERCRDIVVVPVRADALVAGDDQDTLPREYGAMVQRGFELVWSPSTAPKDPCYLCEQSGGRCAYGDKTGFVGCLCSGGKVGLQDCHSSGASHASASRVAHSKKIIYIVAGILSTLLLCLLSLISYKKYGFRRKSKETSRIESFLQKNGSIHPKRYTYAQVKRMTKSFAEKLGQGGFGAVYRGDLADGRQIAVKMLKDYKTDGEDFINEVASISRTSHVNIVTLSGFCLEGSKRALIYDYMPNGSLERYAFKDNSKAENTLSWEKLFDVAVGIARGLEYLHRGCNTRIVHFDIKPHNILLDQDFCPKISDFGLAKLCLNKESAISIGGARGTIGYIAPEVYSKQFGTVSSKSDVYSYGMMILEMVGARDKNINANSESSSQYFPQWIYEHLDAYCVSASEINGEITEIVRKMIVIGLWCIQLCAANRPTMTRVVEMLEGSTSDLELPPKVLLI